MSQYSVTFIPIKTFVIVEVYFHEECAKNNKLP